jgi:hypothetical protein
MVTSSLRVRQLRINIDVYGSIPSSLPCPKGQESQIKPCPTPFLGAKFIGTK